METDKSVFNAKIQWQAGSSLALPHAAWVLSHAPVSSQNQPRIAPRLSSAWVGRWKRWPQGTWDIQRCQLSVKLLQNLTSNHCQQQEMKMPVIQSPAWQRGREMQSGRAMLREGLGILVFITLHDHIWNLNFILGTFKTTHTYFTDIVSETELRNTSEWQGGDDNNIFQLVRRQDTKRQWPVGVS